MLPSTIDKAYERAIPEPKVLNVYKPFSSAVYGETNTSKMSVIAEQIPFNDDDVFLDLGSGVGSFVLFIAGMNNIKAAYGIEIMTERSQCASRLCDRFEEIMQEHNFKIGRHRLFNGDFTDKKYDKYIRKATVIYINNLAFSPELNNWIKNRLLSKKDGTMVITTVPLVRMKRDHSRRYVNLIKSNIFD